MKALVFDMDGTIADLYNVKGWLEALRTENPAPYTKAKPMYDPDILNYILEAFKLQGWKIIVTSWLAKGSTSAYDRLVCQAKIEWLHKINYPYDEIHLVAYGTRKETVTAKYGGFQVLIDDNAEVRSTWNLGSVIDASTNIIEELVDLL